MCSIQQISLGFLFGSSIFYALIIGLLNYQYQQVCFGDWGMKSPPLQYKNGKGMCSLVFELKTAFKKDPLLKWEATYSGDWKQGKKHGYGVYNSLSGNKYEGEWNFNLRQGEGSFYLFDGTKFSGTWKEDRFTGNNNKLVLRVSSLLKYPQAASFINESTYLGEIYDGSMHGSGTIHFGSSNSARKLHGKFKHGSFIGQGSISLANGALLLIEDFEKPLDNGKLLTRAIMTSNSFGKPVKFEWDGIELKVLEEGIVVSVPHGINYDSSNETTPHNKLSVIHLACYELYDILNTLQWFEFHFIFTKQYLLADIYTFEFVDLDTNTQQSKMDF